MLVVAVSTCTSQLLIMTKTPLVLHVDNQDATVPFPLVNPLINILPVLLQVNNRTHVAQNVKATAKVLPVGPSLRAPLAVRGVRGRGREGGRKDGGFLW